MKLGICSNEKIVEDTIKTLKAYKLPLKPTPPERYVNYKKLSFDKKQEILNNSQFWAKDDIKTYLDTMERFESERQSNIDHLQWCLKQTNDQEQKTIIQLKIDELKSDIYWVIGKGPVLERTLDKSVEFSDNKIDGWDE